MKKKKTYDEKSLKSKINEINNLLDDISKIEIKSIAEEIYKLSFDETSNENKISKAIKSAINRRLMPFTSKIKSITNELEAEKKYFKYKSNTSFERMKDIPEFINLSKENKANTPDKKTLSILWYVGILLAVIIELYFSYDLLRANVPVFDRNPLLAGLMGTITLLLAVALKKVQMSSPMPKIDTTSNKITHFGLLFLIVITFIALQALIYQMQTHSPVSFSEVSASELNTNNFNELAVKFGIESESPNSNSQLDVDSLYYTLVSISIFIFLFIALGAIQEIDKQKMHSIKKNQVWVDADNEYLHYLKLSSAASGAIKSAKHVNELVKDIIVTVENHVQLLIIQNKQKIKNEQSKNKKTEEDINKLLKRYDEISKQIESYKSKQEVAFEQAMSNSPLGVLVEKQKNLMSEVNKLRSSIRDTSNE